MRLSRVSNPDDLQDFFNLILPVTTEKNLIRLGAEGDGGYLVPDDLSGCVACFSPGVSNIAEFEIDIADRGIPCYLADFSVEKAPVDHHLFDFEKKFIGLKDTDNYMTLDSWVNSKCNRDGDLILQMDIEGAEYTVILNASYDLLKRFRIIIIEFHYLTDLLAPRSLTMIAEVFKKLLVNFDILHIHPNNCCGHVKYRNFDIPDVMEFTFLRKDRTENKILSVNFPHYLDHKNVSDHKDIILPKCWYGINK